MPAESYDIHINEIDFSVPARIVASFYPGKVDDTVVLRNELDKDLHLTIIFYTILPEHYGIRANSVTILVYTGVLLPAKQLALISEVSWAPFDPSNDINAIVNTPIYCSALFRHFFIEYT